MIITGLYLDTRRTPEGKGAPLKLSLNRHRKTAYLYTGIRLSVEDWDASTQRAKSRQIQHIIDLKRVKVDTLLLELQEQGKLDGLTITEVRDLLQRLLSPAEDEPQRFMAHLRAFASTRKKPRTREIYEATANKIEQFDPQHRLLDFQDINVGWLDRFNAFLAKTAPKRNARNIHLRNIRAVFNDAIKKDITTCYPFRKYEIKAEPTQKRALCLGDLRKLLTAQVPAWQQKYLDFFALSFMLIGINTEDLVHALPSDIHNGRLDYIRAKTYRPYSIQIEPEAMAIIEKYQGKSHLLNILDTYSCTHHWTSKVDRVLKEISKAIDIPPISMYWARHSWATIASALDIPKETIRAAMGHSDTSVTDIYIDFDISKIDRANRQILDFILYDKQRLNPIELFNLNIKKLEGMRMVGAS